MCLINHELTSDWLFPTIRNHQRQNQGSDVKGGIWQAMAEGIGRLAAAQADSSNNISTNVCDAPCSNDCLPSLAYSILPSRVPPERCSKYLGHILMRPTSPDSLIRFNPTRTPLEPSTPVSVEEPHRHSGPN